MEFIIAFIIALVKAIIKWIVSAVSGAEGENSESIWKGVTEAGKAVMDWWGDPEVSRTEKFATVYGMSYLIAPDATERFTDHVGEAATSLAGSIADTVGNVVTTVWDSLKKNPILLVGLGVAAYFVFFKKDKQVVMVPPPPSREQEYIDAWRYTR